MSIAAVLVFIGGQFGMLVHNAFVQHQVCAAHNELEHATGLDDHHSTASALAKGHVDADADADAARVASGGEPVDDEHEHCELTPLAVEPTACPSVKAQVVHAPPGSCVCALFPATVVVQRLAGYRIAPKQSPPA